MILHMPGDEALLQAVSGYQKRGLRAIPSRHQIRENLGDFGQCVFIQAFQCLRPGQQAFGGCALCKDHFMRIKHLLGFGEAKPS